MIGTRDNKIGFINLNNLPNLKIPTSSEMFDIIEVGSKFTCSKILASKSVYSFGCSDGRCMIGAFEDNYNGLRPVTDASKKMSSKSMKKESSYSNNPVYGQINDIDMGI